MIALRLFSQVEVEQQLWRLKCVKVKEYETAALWRTKSGFCFSVPQYGPDKRCDELTLGEILADIRRYGGG